MQGYSQDSNTPCGTGLFWYADVLVTKVHVGPLVLHANLFIALKGTWTFLTAKGTLFVLVLSELEGKLLEVQNVLLVEQSSQSYFTKSTCFYTALQSAALGY